MSPVRPDVIVVGQRLGVEDHRLRDFLTRAAQPFEWVEAGTPEAEEILTSHGAAGAEVPVLIEKDPEGDTVVAPATVESMIEAWRLDRPPTKSGYDIAIVGAGPAGLSAAVYAASDGLSTVVIERDLPGGQASHTSLIENFFGFPEGIGGAELARLGGRQAEKFGADLALLRGVTGNEIEPSGRMILELEGGFRIAAPLAIVAPGMDWRRLDVEGVDELLDRGVYYGAGRSEAAQCSDDDVIVVGAGNSAGQAVLDLGNHDARVTMLVRGGDLSKSMSGYLVDRIRAHPLIEVRLCTQVDAVHADGRHLCAVSVRGPKGGVERLAAVALFLCIGGAPRTSWAEESGVRTGPAGFVLTGPDLLDGGDRPRGWPLERDPLALETSVPGVFAAGDVRHGSTKRVGAAVGDGAMAVALAHRRIEELEAH